MDIVALTIIIIVALIACLTPLWVPILMAILFLHKVGPNQAMVVYGAGGTKVLVGGSRIVLPRFQQVKYFSLDVMPFTVELVQELYLAEQETHVSVEAVVLVNVGTDMPDLTWEIEQQLSKGQLERTFLEERLKKSSPEANVRRAIELFLDKSQSEREQLIRVVIEGHLSGIIGKYTFEALVNGYEIVTQEMFRTTAADLGRMGLRMTSFTMRNIRRWPSAPETLS